MKNNKKNESISFVANKINLFLLEWYHAAIAARNMTSPYTKYADPSEYWQYQYLEKKGYIIKTKNEQGKYFWRISKKGMRFAELLNFVLGKKPKWDKKWRILIFDIPNKRNRMRDFLRKKLKELGFYKMQHSVWINPYPLPESLADFLNKYKVAKSVRCLVVEDINFDKDIKEHFGL